MWKLNVLTTGPPGKPQDAPHLGKNGVEMVSLPSWIFWKVWKQMAILWIRQLGMNLFSNQVTK